MGGEIDHLRALGAKRMAAATGLMPWQHRLVRADDLSRVDAAFFTANGLLSVVMCSLFIFAEILG